MYRSDGRKYLMLRLIKALNVILMAVPFYIVWTAYCSRHSAVPYGFRGGLAITALFVFLYIVFGRTYEGFLVSYFRVPQMVFSQGLALLLTDGVMFLVTWLLMKRFPFLLPYAAAFAAQVCLACLWSAASRCWYFAVYPPKRTAVIYDGRNQYDPKQMKEKGIELHCIGRGLV